MDWIEIAAKAGIIVVAGLIAAGGNPVVRALLRWIDRSPRNLEPTSTEPATAGADDELRIVQRNLGLEKAQRDLPGGRWVGILERLAMYATILAGFPAGIALVLGVKGLGRYADLVTDSAAGVSRKGELFIIGTFASLLWAGLWAGVAYWGVRAW